MSSRRRLFRKYAAPIMALVGGALLVSGAFSAYFAYEESKRALAELQREKAYAAATRIEQYLKEIERQISWTTLPQADSGETALETRRLDCLKLLRQVPAITDISLLNGSGRELLRVSRLEIDTVGSNTDFATSPKFTKAQAGKSYFSRVYFRKETEPYMTIATAWGRGDRGVTIAEVNLKFIWDVVSQIKIGEAGLAYVVDSHGQLIAHPDISLVLQKTDFSVLAQVAWALRNDEPNEAMIAHDHAGDSVLTAFAPIGSVDWFVFIEQPLQEAFAPIYALTLRTGLLLLAGLMLAALASFYLAHRMVKPIRELQVGAAEIGAGELGHRLDVKTGDELQALAEQFNTMATRLEESYANLERKVEERTSELKESLEHQTATSEILRAIASSPNDVRPVFDIIAERAARLCNANYGLVYRFDGEWLHLASAFGMTLEGVDAIREKYPLRPRNQSVSARAVSSGAVVHVSDVLALPDYQHKDAAHLAGFRGVLGVPMVRQDKIVGAITVTSVDVGDFSEKQTELLKTFGSQAVIAIENVRLFQELQTRNRELSEALDQQTATTEILRVISSSPTDTKPVFETIVANAARLCEANLAMVLLYDGERLSAAAHTIASAEFAEYLGRGFPISRQTTTGRAVLERKPVQVVDILADPEFLVTPAHRSENVRTVLAAPMLREHTLIGAIAIWRREVRAFTEQQTKLLQTFADQAVIAIANVRLFNETKESLDQQTATSEILKVISGSMSDAAPVFEAIAQSGLHLFEDANVWVVLRDGDAVRAAAITERNPERIGKWRQAFPTPLTRDYLNASAILDGKMVDIPDVNRLPLPLKPGTANFAAMGYRAATITPMMRGSEAIGTIGVARLKPGPLSAKQIALLQTFADQAVIAIENVRLFRELQQRTRELARSLEQLKALGEVGRTVSSTLDLNTVLTTIVSYAVQLSGTDAGSIYEYSEDALRLRATLKLEDSYVEALRANPVKLGEGAVGRAAATQKLVEIPDIFEEAAYPERLKHMMSDAGFRAVLAVPLLHEDHILGALAVLRKRPGAFPAETMELVTSFATQSALAIENARLFREIEDKSRQVEAASRHKSEFLANMSHELRTPLNAIIGFSEVLNERMFGELNEKQAEYVQDIHSSGRHLHALINDILDLSKIEAGRMELELAPFDLPTAISDAATLVRERANRNGIDLKVNIDERLGALDGDERKVKQILLNLLSNALKFTPQGGRITVTAALTNLGVEISVADTGIGIAAADHEIIFEEFRQAHNTRAREGTGLGLTLTRKFVEMHRGKIRVSSELGKGATFTFTLPMRS